MQYEVIDNATGDVDLTHTEVPQSFRGKGVAKILAKVIKFSILLLLLLHNYFVIEEVKF